MKDYNIVKIKDGVYCINEYNLSTMFVINGSQRALVIDTGLGVGDFKSVIDKLTDKPYDVVITHAHVDHIGGRGQFDKLYLNAKDECLIKQVTCSYRKGYYHMMKDILRYKSIKSKDKKISKVVKEPEIIRISEGYEFNLGDKIIKVIETSGHTLGSISLLDPADRLIFSGDAVNPLMILYLSNADSITNYVKSIKKILSYEGYDQIWASHFEEPISKDTINKVIANAEDIIKKGKNGKLPIIRFHKKDKILAIYKSNRLI